jgi:RuvB-like protein 1 (pontin 52)
LGEKVSLRYSLQLLAPASILAKVSGRQGGVIEVSDVEECEGLFLDAGRSAKNLASTNGFIA